MSEEQPSTDSKANQRASSAIWVGIKYSIYVYILWHAAKWLGWVN